MEITQPVEWLETPRTGYVMNAEFSEANKDLLINCIETTIHHSFSESVFCTPRDSLHITLLDWIAPLVDYSGKDKVQLFKQIWPQYDKIMTNILNSTKGPVDIHFNKLNVSPSTIFIVGQDDGTFYSIRQRFLEEVDLLPNTKLPPQIIHSSLIRFTQAIDLEQVRSVIAQIPIDFHQSVTDFRLLRTYKEPLLEFKLIKRYSIGKSAI